MTQITSRLIHEMCKEINAKAKGKLVTVVIDVGGGGYNLTLLSTGPQCVGFTSREMYRYLQGFRAGLLESE